MLTPDLAISGIVSVSIITNVIYKSADFKNYAPSFKVEQNLVGSTQNVSARNRKRQPKDLETYRLESARSLHTEPTHSRAKETAETA